MLVSLAELEKEEAVADLDADWVGRKLPSGTWRMAIMGLSARTTVDNRGYIHVQAQPILAGNDVDENDLADWKVLGAGVNIAFNIFPDKWSDFEELKRAARAPDSLFLVGKVVIGYVSYDDKGYQRCTNFRSVKRTR